MLYVLLFRTKGQKKKLLSLSASFFRQWATAPDLIGSWPCCCSHGEKVLIRDYSDIWNRHLHVFPARLRLTNWPSAFCTRRYVISTGKWQIGHGRWPICNRKSRTLHIHAVRIGLRFQHRSSHQRWICHKISVKMIFPQVHVKRLLHPLYQGVRDFYDKMTNGCSSSNHLSLTVSCQTEPRRFVLGSTWFLRKNVKRSLAEAPFDKVEMSRTLHIHAGGSADRIPSVTFYIIIDPICTSIGRRANQVKKASSFVRAYEDHATVHIQQHHDHDSKQHHLLCRIFAFLIIITRNNSTNIVKPDHQSQTNKKVFIHRPPETPPSLADQQNNKTSNNNEQQR